MSKMVRATSSARKTLLEPVLSGEMRHKAHALFRYCVHFESLKLQDRLLYRKLQKANIYETHEISATMTISLNSHHTW